MCSLGLDCVLSISPVSSIEEGEGGRERQGEVDGRRKDFKERLDRVTKTPLFKSNKICWV